MSVNRVNASIASAQLQKALGVNSGIYQNLAFVIELKPEERLAMAEFGEKDRSFVIKALAIAEQNPDILPASFNIADMKADVSVVEDLYPLIVAVTNLLGKLEDTHFAAGSLYHRVVGVPIRETCQHCHRHAGGLHLILDNER